MKYVRANLRKLAYLLLELKAVKVCWWNLICGVYRYLLINCRLT